MFAGYFLGKLAGATTFALAKVKNPIGRIGIFDIRFNGTFYRILTSHTSLRRVLLGALKHDKESGTGILMSSIVGSFKDTCYT